jgi:hypothetical protein
MTLSVVDSAPFRLDALGDLINRERTRLRR